MQRRTLMAGAAALGLAAPTGLRAQGAGRTEIQFWYGLSGPLAPSLEKACRWTLAYATKCSVTEESGDGDSVSRPCPLGRRW